jgi:hypothetical protein
MLVLGVNKLVMQSAREPAAREPNKARHSVMWPDIGIVSSVSFVSTKNTARTTAGCVSLVLAPMHGNRLAFGEAQFGLVSANVTTSSEPRMRFVEPSSGLADARLDRCP